MEKDWQRCCEIHDKARIDELTGSVDLGAFLNLEQTAKNEGFFGEGHFVALIDDLVVGFVSFEKDEITWLYVDPAYYRKGVGRSLLRFAIEKFENEVVVEVLSGNQPAIQLYLNEGFQVIERRKGKLEGNETYDAEGLILKYIRKH